MEIASGVGPKFATTRRPTQAARSPPRRGQNSRRNRAQPGPSQVITLTPTIGHPGWQHYLQRGADLITTRAHELGSLPAAYREQYQLTQLPAGQLGDEPTMETRRRDAFRAAQRALATQSPDGVAAERRVRARVTPPPRRPSTPRAIDPHLHRCPISLRRPIARLGGSSSRRRQPVALVRSQSLVIQRDAQRSIASFPHRRTSPLAVPVAVRGHELVPTGGQI